MLKKIIISFLFIGIFNNNLYAETEKLKDVYYKVIGEVNNHKVTDFLIISEENFLKNKLKLKEIKPEFVINNYILSYINYNFLQLNGYLLENEFYNKHLLKMKKDMSKEEYEDLSQYEEQIEIWSKVKLAELTLFEFRKNMNKFQFMDLMDDLKEFHKNADITIGNRKCYSIMTDKEFNIECKKSVFE